MKRTCFCLLEEPGYSPPSLFLFLFLYLSFLSFSITSNISLSLYLCPPLCFQPSSFDSLSLTVFVTLFRILYLFMPFSLSVSFFVYLLVPLSLCLSLRLSLCVSVFFFVPASLSLSFFVFIYFSVSHTFPFVSLSLIYIFISHIASQQSLFSHVFFPKGAGLGRSFMIQIFRPLFFRTRRPGQHSTSARALPPDRRTNSSPRNPGLVRAKTCRRFSGSGHFFPPSLFSIDTKRNKQTLITSSYRNLIYIECLLGVSSHLVAKPVVL